METRDIVLLVSLVLGGGGLAGVVYAIAKVPREAGQIVVQSAEVVVNLQSKLLNDVRADNERISADNDRLDAAYRELRKEHALLEERLAEVERTSPSPDDFLALQRQNQELEVQLAEARSEVVTCRAEADALKGRVTDLEAELAAMTGPQ